MGAGHKISIVRILLLFAVCVLCICGCGSDGGNNETGAKNGANSGKSVMAVVFPEYDWTAQIIADVEGAPSLDLLIDSGVDIHSYQPSVEDIVAISNCDMFIYVGGESEAWVEDVLKNTTNRNMVVVRLMDAVAGRLREEEVVEGMQAEEEEEDEEGPEYDEHIWLSLNNAKLCCEAITDALCSIDSANGIRYRDNLSAYEKKLDELDGLYRETVNGSDKNTLLFGDRFPFRYLTEDYGLKYYAAFAGCSAESNASFETIAFLADKADALKINTVLAIDGSDEKIARTVVNNSKSGDKQVAVLDSMQSVTNKDIEAGATYYGIMEKNLDVIREALK